jgi:hypothetical protein
MRMRGDSEACENLRQRLALDGDAAGGGASQSHQHFAERRLAGARFSHEAQDLALAERQVDAIQRPRLAAEDDVDVPDLDEGCCAHASTSWARMQALR